MKKLRERPVHVKPCCDSKVLYDNPKRIELEAHERALMDRFLDELIALKTKSKNL